MYSFIQNNYTIFYNFLGIDAPKHHQSPTEHDYVQFEKDCNGIDAILFSKDFKIYIWYFVALRATFLELAVEVFYLPFFDC